MALEDLRGDRAEALPLLAKATDRPKGGLLPFGQEMRSLEILTQQVVPAFK